MPEKDVLKGTYTFPKAQNACAERNKKIPSLEEGMSITLNSKLINSTLSQEYIWTSNTVTSYGTSRPRIIMLYYSMLYQHEPYWANVTLCVDE